MDNKSKTIIGLFIVIAVLLLLRQCSPSKTPESVLKHTSDTIRTIRIDTVYSTKIVMQYIHDVKPIKETPIPLTDTNGLSLCKTFNYYEDSLIDSNIRIITKQTIRGELKQQWTSYKLLVPKYITKTITNNITTTQENYRMYCFSFYGGLGIGGNTSQLSSIEPFLGMRWKTTYFDYGYNLMNSTHNLRIGIDIFKIK